MRFRSVGSSSNFAQAGKSAADETVRAFAASRRNSTDFGKLTQKATQIRSAEKQAAIKAGAQVTQAGIEAQAFVKKNEIKLAGEAARDKGKRKAGALAAGGKLISAAGAYGGEKRTRREVGSEDSYFADQIAKTKKSADELRAQAENYGKGTDTSTPKTGTDGEVVDSSTSAPQTVSSIGNGSYSGSLDNLSDDDKKWIAYTVSSEASLGTDDEFGVAGVVLNRMKSSQYPSSAYAVGHQKGQFEGVEIGNSVHDKALYDRLFSPEGLQKLEGALTTLDGRDSFKGQALLHNRSSKGNKDGQLDPMFAPSGNFFHHSYQS